MSVGWRYAVASALLLLFGICKGNEVKEYDTIVVGLGAAGTVAASTLARAGKKVLALEAQDRIGGRVHTVPFGDGIVEVGAEWLHGTEDSRTYKAATEYNVTLLPQEPLYQVIQSNGRLAEAVVNEILEHALNYYDDKPDKPEPFGDYCARKLTQYVKEKHPDVFEDKKLLKQIINYVKQEVANTWAAYDSNDLNGADAYVSIGGHQSMSWHRNGYKTFFDIILNTYKDGPGLSSLDIKLKTEVIKINWPQVNAGKVFVTTKDGTNYKADNVIITVSLGVLKAEYKTLFSPSLPPEKMTAIEKLKMGLNGKIIFSFPKIWWPSKNLTTLYGFLWDEDDLKKIDPADIWTTKICQISTPMGSDNTLTLWTNGEVTKKVENMSEEIVKVKLIGILRRFMGTNTTIPEPTGILRSKWFTNEFVRGTYSYDSMDAVDVPSARSDLATPLVDASGKPRVLFAGEASHPTRFATVHGAADTGHREAMRLLSAVKNNYDEPTEFDTIVVGLGTSGTVAASTLARAGKKVLGLEAQNRVGGRVCTVPFGDGVVEAGAEWIQGTEGSITYHAAMSHNVTIIPQDLAYHIKDSNGELANPAASEILNYAMEIDAKPDKPEPLGDYIVGKLTEYAKEKKPDVFQDKKLLKQIMDYKRQEMSNEWGAYDSNDLNAAAPYMDIEGHQTMSWHRNGYKTFFDIMLNKYKNGPGLPTLDIKLNTEVVKIEWPQEGEGKVSVTTKDGAVYKANNVIVTLSVGVLKEKFKTLFSPSLPEKKITAIEKIKMGLIGKIIFSFPNAWWPSKHSMLAFLWNEEDLKKISSADQWTTKLVEVSPPMGSTNTLTVWTSGDVTKQIESMPDEIVKVKTIETLKRFMGANTTVPEPTAMLRTKWFSNEFTRGTYSYDCMGSADVPSARADLAEPILDSAGNPRVLFAGEASHPMWFATVHGAADTGHREAMRLLATKQQ